MGLFGELALFLLGMEQMPDAPYPSTAYILAVLPVHAAPYGQCILSCHLLHLLQPWIASIITHVIILPHLLLPGLKCAGRMPP